MKAILFLPLAYFAGEHGFAIFAPYAAFWLTVWYLTHRRKTA